MTEILESKAPPHSTKSQQCQISAASLFISEKHRRIAQPCFQKKRGAAGRGYQERLMGSERWDCKLTWRAESVNNIASACYFNKKLTNVGPL